MHGAILAPTTDMVVGYYSRSSCLPFLRTGPIEQPSNVDYLLGVFFHYVLLACHFCAQGHLGNLAMWMEVWLRAMAAAWDLAREGTSADVAQVGSRGGVGGGLGVQAAWGKPVCMSMGPNT